MEKIIKLPNKCGDDVHLKLLSKPDGSESKTYALKLSTHYLRVGKISNNNFLDPPGGPLIVEKSQLAGTNYIVKSIDFASGFGYTITLE